MKQQVFIFNDTTEQQRRAYLAAKTFWLSHVLGAGEPIWITDPRDAQYLNTTVADLKTTAAALVKDGLVLLDDTGNWATATDTLRNQEDTYRAQVARGARLHQAHLQRRHARRPHQHVISAFAPGLESSDLGSALYHSIRLSTTHGTARAPASQTPPTPPLPPQPPAPYSPRVCAAHPPRDNAPASAAWIGVAACSASIAFCATLCPCAKRLNSSIVSTDAGAIARNTCDCPTSFAGSVEKSCVAIPPVSIAASTSSTNDKPDPFQYPIGSARCVRSITAGIVRQLAALIVATRHRQRVAPLAIRRQRSIRKLDIAMSSTIGADVALTTASRNHAPRNRHHQRIISQRHRARAPRRQVGQSIRPAHRRKPRIRRLPSIRPRAHPVRRIRQRHAAQPMLPRQLHRPLHRRIRRQVSRPAPPRPALNRTEPRHLLRPRARIDQPAAHMLRKPRQPRHAMRPHSVTIRLGRQPRTQAPTARALHPTPAVRAQYVPAAPRTLCVS